MNIEIINLFIKFVGMYISLCFCFIKIIDYPNLKIIKKIFLFIITILLSCIQCLIQSCTPLLFRIIIIYFSYSFILSMLTNTKFATSTIITILSLAISYIFSTISALIIMGIAILFVEDYKHPCIVFIIFCLNFGLVNLLFRLKRFKHGIPFLQKINNNEYFSFIVLILNIIVIFTYIFVGKIQEPITEYITFSLIIIAILIGVIIQKTFILYQKQKLQLKTLKDYEQEIQTVTEKLETAIQEKQKLVKSNHEFFHRQEALNKKLDNIINTQSLHMNTEFGEDYGDILDRINQLSNEYTSKIHTVPKLTKTQIIEIDDMLNYMQSECIKNNIEFILKIDCDIHNMINNYIQKNQLETLLGDLIRNSIIAINHSTNTYKSIMVIFGIKDNNYGLCIFDSGIPFEISTLLNLGLKPSSTHETEGGTGIGFITTFETLNSCNASFIINEITNSNYTKSLEMKFDGKHEYTIISDRSIEIQKQNKFKRNIIIKN